MPAVTKHAKPARDHVAKAWDSYWQHMQSVQSQGGPQDSALAQFWSETFDRVLVDARHNLQVLDVGCGSGVLARFTSVFGGARAPGVIPRVWGLDYSHAALASVRKFSPGITCIAGNAAKMPFEDGTFDLVTSQFGIEYAGPAALSEAARVLRPNGQLATALHVRGGGIYKECEVNRQAVDAVRDCNLLEYFRQVVEAFHHARQSVRARILLRDAYGRFAQAVTATEQVLRRWGRAVASGLVHRLRGDVVRMVQRLQAFDASELMAWADFMANELRNYSQRMASMLEAALSCEMIERLTARLNCYSLQIQLRNLLKIGDEETPVAWMVTATKK